MQFIPNIGFHYAVHRVSPGFVASLNLGAAVVLAFIVSQQFRLRINGAKRSSCGLVSSAPSKDHDCL